MSMKEVFITAVSSKEGKRSLIMIGIGILLTCITLVFKNTESNIPFIISIGGMLMCMLGTDQFARIIFLIHSYEDEDGRE